MYPRVHHASQLLILCAACFNPSGQLDTTDATSTGPGTSTTGGTTAAEPTTGSTSGSTTDAVTTSTTGVGATTDASTGTSTGGMGGCAENSVPDAYCAAMNKALPFCDLDTSTCVECVEKPDCGAPNTCDVETNQCVECVESLDCADAIEPACNPESQTCGCTEHSDCVDTACDLEVHTCFPKALTAVVHSRASNAPTCSDPNLACDANAPCCSMTAALAKGLTMNKPYVVIRVAPSMEDGLYESGLAFNAPTIGKRIAVLGTDMPEIRPSMGGAPVIFVNAATRAYIAGLKLSSATAGAGVSCYMGSGAWVDDVVTEGLNAGVGFFTAGCPLEVRRSLVKGGNGGVWSASGGTAKLSDTIVFSPTSYALKTEMGGTLDVVFSTVVDRSGMAGRLLQCTGLGSAITARNSALLAVPEMVSNSCVDVTTTYSVVTAKSLSGPTAPQIADVDVGPLFIDFNGGDLHVKPGAKVLSEAAQRQLGDSLTDFDRQPRPLGEGTFDWAGADRP